MLLVDTNIWFKYYWRLPLPEEVSRRFAEEPLALSPISILEIATKIRKDHFPGIQPLEAWLAAAVDGYAVASVTPEIAAAAGTDTWDHQDPADRLLVHTALANEFTFLHTDRVIRKRADLKQSYFPLSG